MAARFLKAGKFYTTQRFNWLLYASSEDCDNALCRENYRRSRRRYLGRSYSLLNLKRRRGYLVTSTWDNKPPAQTVGYLPENTMFLVLARKVKEGIMQVLTGEGLTGWIILQHDTTKYPCVFSAVTSNPIENTTDSSNINSFSPSSTQAHQGP